MSLYQDSLKIKQRNKKKERKKKTKEKNFYCLTYSNYEILDFFGRRSKWLFLSKWKKMDAGSTFVIIKCKHTFKFNLWQQSKWMYIQSVYSEEHTNTHKYLLNICNILVTALSTPDGLLRIFHILYFNPHKYLVKWAVLLQFYRWENQGTEGEATFPSHRISNAWDWETNPGQIFKANVSWVQAFLPSF